MKTSWKRRRLTLWLTVLLLGGAVWLGVYVWDQGFTRKWRGLIAKELAKHGLRAEIGRLTLDPVEGLTARDVKLFDVWHRNQLLADIDRISLDVDVARLMNQEDFLRTIHLQKADVSLPVDPSDPKSEWLAVADLNARLVFQQDKIEIARAEGVVSGILIKATGTVKKPVGLKGKEGEKERLREERSRQLREMRERRGALRAVLRVMDRFQVPVVDGQQTRAHKAELTLEVQGDMSDIDRMEVRGMLTGGSLEHRAGFVQGFEANIRMLEGVMTLQKLEIRDPHGALRATAAWRIRQAGEVELTAECTMNLQSLLRTALDDAPWLGEVVCYTPPDLRWDGRWLIKPSPDQFPLEGQGSIRAGRFLTRGVVFDGLEAKLAMKPGRMFYVREGVLTHLTGEVRGQAMMDPAGGRYELDWRMAASPAVPFLPLGASRDILARFGFESASRIAVRMQGDRAKGAAKWRHSGRIQLRNFSYQDQPLAEASADVVINDALEAPLIFHNAMLEMEGGVGRVREIRADLEKRLLWINGGESTLMPAPLLHMFAPTVGQALEKYKFVRAPETRFDGVIDLNGLQQSDYQISLRTRSRCSLDIGGKPMEFDQTSGTLGIKGPLLTVQLTGTAVPGTSAFGVLKFDEALPAAFAGTFPLANTAIKSPAKEQEGTKASGAPSTSTVTNPAWVVEVRTPGKVSLNVLGKTWPMDQFAGSMKAGEGRIAGTGGAKLFGGKFGASLEFPREAEMAHNGSLVLENVGFGPLAAVMSPGSKTEGRLTGNFSWQIPSAEEGSLTGRGEARLEDGNIFALPLLGPLSGLVDAIVPGENVGYSVARNATTTFEVAEGKVRLPDFEAATGTFRLMVSGDADYLKDQVDFGARVNLRGPPGMLLYPVSKLFEYAADGTLKEPAWRPRFFSGSSRSKEKPGTDAATPAAPEKPVSESTSPEQSQPEQQRAPMQRAGGNR